jgi:hypothetical protein
LCFQIFAKEYWCTTREDPSDVSSNATHEFAEYEFTAYTHRQEPRLKKCIEKIKQSSTLFLCGNLVVEDDDLLLETFDVSYLDSSAYKKSKESQSIIEKSLNDSANTESSSILPRPRPKSNRSNQSGKISLYEYAFLYINFKTNLNCFSKTCFQNCVTK